MFQRKGGEIPEDLPEDFSLFRLQPLTDLRSDTSVMSFKDGHGVVEPRDPFISYVLVSMALAVLLMGCINFVNLAIWSGLAAGQRRSVCARRRVLDAGS